MPFPFGFEVRATDGAARSGVFETPHGRVETPAFMPVGTLATVKALDPIDLRSAGAQMILANAYHLHLRPGDELVREMGGLHSFMQWRGPILTDSGGFQVFSLETLRTVSEEGVEFRSHIDGSRRFFTPESVMEIEGNLGADVIMQFDHVIPGQSDASVARDASERSLRWLERCRLAFEEVQRRRLTGDSSATTARTTGGPPPIFNLQAAARLPSTNPTHSVPDTRVSNDLETVTPAASAALEGRIAPPTDRTPQALFPIVQGGIHPELRREAARSIVRSGDWIGYGIGGLSVGESKPDMHRILEVLNLELPADRPRYLMGVGFPEDLIEGIRRGIDLFDCVAPTRMGRNGTAFTLDGRINIKRADFRADPAPLDAGCTCTTCRRFSRAYLRHLYVSDELLGLRLLSLHNVHFLIHLAAQARRLIANGSFDLWAVETLRRLGVPPLS